MDYFLINFNNKVNNEWTEEVISVLGPGEVFGELSLMRGHKRSATCITACK